MFASKTLGEHLVRGVLGIGATVIVLTAPASEPAWLDAIARIALGLVALALLRGCPMCWLAGLVETIAARFGRRDASCRACRRS
jgi:NAD(P)-dependent dehydrogenase (short-subunit alcohol dehydrogenase family)